MDQEKQDRLIREAKRQARKGVTHAGQLISLGVAWHAGQLWQSTGRRGKNRDTGRLDEEVEHAFEVPLGFLLDRRNAIAAERDFNGQKVPIVEFQYAGFRIWGATAHMLVALGKELRNNS